MRHFSFPDKCCMQAGGCTHWVGGNVSNKREEGGRDVYYECRHTAYIYVIIYRVVGDQRGEGRVVIL